MLRKITVYFDDGKPSWKYYIDRHYNGKCQFFHINNGKIAYEGSYFNGIMAGTWIGYCPQGEIHIIYNRTKEDSSNGVEIVFN